MAVSLDEIADWMKSTQTQDSIDLAQTNPCEGLQIQNEDQDVFCDIQPTKDYRMMIEQHLNTDFGEERKKLQQEETHGVGTTQSFGSGNVPLSTMSETNKADDLVLPQTTGLGRLHFPTENPTINMRFSSPLMTPSATEELTMPINGGMTAPPQQCLSVTQVSLEECDSTDQFITSLLEPIQPQPTNSDAEMVTLVNLEYEETLTDDVSGDAIPTRIPVGKKRNCKEMSNNNKNAQESNTSEDCLPLYKCKPFENDKKKERQRKNALRAYKRRANQRDEITTLHSQVKDLRNELEKISQITSLQNQLQVKNPEADLVTELQHQLQYKDQVIALLNAKVTDLENALQTKEQSIEVRHAKLVELNQLY